MAMTRPQLEQFADKERRRFEQLLKDFVEIPSVSADPDRKPDLERCAELGLATVRAFGGRAEIHRVPDGPPGGAGLVRDRQGPADRDRLQPPRRRPGLDGDRALEDPPFTFIQQGDTYLGRGTTDDKGPALSALYGARAAIDAGVPVNIKVLWELEEEVGSPQLRPDAEGDRPRRGHRCRGGVGHGVGVAGPARGVGRPARAPADDASASRPPRPTSTPAPRAASPATRWPSSPRSSARSSTPAPGA